MGQGILMSRTQANAAMAAAGARASGGCGPCPPSPTNGGVTGTKPATGPSPSGQAPSPRNRMLRNIPPSGEIARATGNTPCGGNRNASQNVNQNGYTNNPNVLPVLASQLTARPVSPYTDNPLEIPTGQPGGNPATDGTGEPSTASQTGCRPCVEAPSPFTSGAGDDYNRGMMDGSQDPGPEPHPYAGQSPQYYQGYGDSFVGRGRGRSRPLNLQRYDNRGNLRRGVNRRGVLI